MSFATVNRWESGRTQISAKAATALAELEAEVAAGETGAAGPGFAGDPRVGRILRTLFERVTDEPQRNERAVLLAMARELAADGGE